MGHSIPILMHMTARYGHLEVVEQLMAAPGINMDQLNQVESDRDIASVTNS